MIRKILRSGDPILRRVSKPVQKIDKKITSLIADLKDTLTAQKDPEGVGLAAPQIGKNLRIFVMLDNKKIRAIINPEILKTEKVATVKSGQPKSGVKKGDIMEGCLSLPNYYGPLKRDASVELKYLGEDGSEHIETFTDFSAQIVRHEVDHLNGVLFVDRLLEQKKSLYKLDRDEWEKVEI
jgi:peptide deformylase